MGCWNVVHYIFIKNQMCHEIVKFWASKIIRILYLLNNADVSKIFAKFQYFDEKINKVMCFSTPEH